MGTEHWKDSMSPRFTRPPEGSTDKTGVGREGAERVGATPEEDNKERKGNSVIVYIFWGPVCHNKLEKDKGRQTEGLQKRIRAKSKSQNYEVKIRSP